MNLKNVCHSINLYLEQTENVWRYGLKPWKLKIMEKVKAESWPLCHLRNLNLVGHIELNLGYIDCSMDVSQDPSTQICNSVTEKVMFWVGYSSKYSNMRPIWCENYAISPRSPWIPCLVAVNRMYFGWFCPNMTLKSGAIVQVLEVSEGAQNVCQLSIVNS